MQRNIRRGRKKKILRTHKDQQQLASDKLFEISHYCEEKFEDESKMLVVDTHRERDKNNEQAVALKIHRSGAYGRQRMKIKQRQYGLKQYRTIQMTQITEKFENNKSKLDFTVQNIFNTIESKQVFVGLKKQISHSKHANPQSETFLEFKPRRRRIDTMPASEKNVHLATIKMTTRQPRSQTIGGRFPNKIKSLNTQKCTNGVLGGQNKLFFEFDQCSKGFKQKLRNNILGFSQRKIGLNFF